MQVAAKGLQVDTNVDRGPRGDSGVGAPFHPAAETRLYVRDATKPTLDFELLSIIRGICTIIVSRNSFIIANIMATPAKRISLKSVMYVWYTHSDIHKSHEFLTDFGLLPVKTTPDKIWYRGYGESPVFYISEKSKTDQPDFLGAGWAVDDYEDLEAATQLPGASPITDADEVIGGKTVAVDDPAGGSIYLHWGHNERKIDPAEEPKKMVYNTWDTKSRQGEFQRFEDGPSHVYKLGHYGYEMHHTQADSVRQWYLNTFTLAATDYITDPQTQKDIMTFIHLDKGEKYVDHHVCALDPNVGLNN